MHEPPDSPSAWNRRLRIFHALLRRGSITTARAASLNGGDRRKALDDLKRLEAHGVPVRKEGDGNEEHWAVDESWRELGHGVDLQTRLAMRFGHELVRGILSDTDFDAAYGALEERLTTLSPDLDTVDPGLDRRFHFVHEPIKDYAPHRATLECLTTAVLGCHRVALEYGTASGELREYPAAAPYSLLVYRRTVYLVCESKGKVRTLPIERIRDVTPLPDHTFEYPRPAEYSPTSHLQDVFGIIRGHEDPTTIRLRFHPQVTQLVTSRRWHPGQQLDQAPDGSVELTFHATGTELASFVLGWGDKVRVLEPKWLVDRVRGELEAACAQYADPADPEPAT